MSFQAPQQPAPFSYRKELDGIRGLAVLLVVAWHAYIVGVRPRIAGYMGVDAFFVLSGYLITRLLVSEKRIRGDVSLRSFYIRRALRILPALAVALAVSGVVAIGTAALWKGFRASVIAVVIYLGNWRVQRLGILTHTWTLAIEEQFYLLWPPLLVMMLRKRVRRRQIAQMLVAVAVLAAVVQLAWFPVPQGATFWAGEFFGGTSTVGAALETYLRAFGLVIGCIVALAPTWFDWAKRAGAAIASIAVIGAIIVGHSEGSVVLYRSAGLVFDLAVAVLIAHVVNAESGVTSRILRLRPLPDIGKVSYGIYLFHVPMYFLAREQLASSSTPVKIAATLVGTAVVTAASYLIVERPALALKKRYDRREPPQIARASTAA